MCESNFRRRLIEVLTQQIIELGEEENNLFVQKDIFGLAVNKCFIPHNYTDSLLFSKQNQNYKYFREL